MVTLLGILQSKIYATVLRTSNGYNCLCCEVINNMSFPLKSIPLCCGQRILICWTCTSSIVVDSFSPSRNVTATYGTLATIVLIYDTCIYLSCGNNEFSNACFYVYRRMGSIARGNVTQERIGICSATISRIWKCSWSVG